jgi:mRNA interferase RelE/StbE
VWELQYTQVAAKAILKLNPSIRERIKKAMEELSQNPDLGKQLTGPLKGLRSLRVGDYRVIYKKEGDTFIILIVTVGHRKHVYD